MYGEFFNKVRKGHVKSPTQRGFSLSKWQIAWESVKEESSLKEEMLYTAGLVVHNLLTEIRDQLESLYVSHSPISSNEQLMMAYIALSNRDRFISGISGMEQDSVNVHSITLNNNMMNNDVTLQEIADGSVDGISKALKNCIGRIYKGLELCPGKQPIPLIDFVSREAVLSQMYECYESYWQGMLWGDYDFEIIDHEYKIVRFKQSSSQEEHYYNLSHMRKSRLSAQSSVIANHDAIKSLFTTDKCVFLIKKGRRRKAITKSIVNSGQEVGRLNSVWRVAQYALYDSFPSVFLDKEHSIGFSVFEALDVFRCLVLMANMVNDNYPVDTQISSSKKLLQYCVKVNKLDLIGSLASATNISFEKAKKIIGFLEYNGEPSRDLWCHPLVSVSNSEFALLTSSLITPVLLRVVEHWLVELGGSLQEKGDDYEKLVVEEVNKELKENLFAIDCNKAESKNVKIQSGAEQIDFIMRVGKVVLIGESKSIVTTDSPISKFRSLNTLEHGANQAKRKTSFVADNVEAVFSFLGWRFDGSIEYEFVPFVANSSRMFVGLKISNVPVIDEKILAKFFEESTFPLLSKFDADGEADNIAWLVLYEDFDEMQSSLKRYINSPPQVNEVFDFFEYKELRLPCLDESSYKVVFSRLAPRDVSVEEQLSKDHIFPVAFSDKAASFIEDVRKII